MRGLAGLETRAEVYLPQLEFFLPPFPYLFFLLNTDHPLEGCTHLTPVP